jgi:predicted dehydrogenase
VYPPGYDEQFARENGIEHVCKSISELASKVDAAMIHGVDWDKHIEKALPFLEAGKPVLIDKPIVGKMNDIRRLLELQANYKTPVFGGSSLRFADEITALKAEASKFGEVTTAFASGPGDFFSYGIHTTEMAQGFLGAGVKSVKYLGENKVALFKLTYHNGLILILQLHAPHHEWSFSIYTATGMHSTTVDSSKLYPPFLDRFLKVVRGEMEFSLSDALEAVAVHIAAWKSKQSGAEVYLDELSADDGFDGAAFAASYSLAKKK